MTRFGGFFVASAIPRACPCGAGFRESSPGDEAAGSRPLRGFNPSRLRPFRAARSACLRPAACAPLRRGLPDLPPLAPARRHRPVANAPMSYPPPCLACKGLSRHILTRCARSGIPRPLARSRALDRTGLPQPTEADEQTHHQVRAPDRESTASARCAATLKSVYFPLPYSALQAARFGAASQAFQAK
jgi:hypothetical protein